MRNLKGSGVAGCHSLVARATGNTKLLVYIYLVFRCTKDCKKTWSGDIEGNKKSEKVPGTVE